MMDFYSDQIIIDVLNFSDTDEEYIKEHKGKSPAPIQWCRAGRYSRAVCSCQAKVGKLDAILAAVDRTMAAASYWK